MSNTRQEGSVMLRPNGDTSIEWLPTETGQQPAGFGFGPELWRSIVDCYSGGQRDSECCRPTLDSRSPGTSESMEGSIDR